MRKRSAKSCLSEPTIRETARDILRLYEKAKTETVCSDDLRGEISISAAEIDQFSRIAEIMTAFQKDHPKVLFRLYSGNADEVCSAIDKRTVDLGFIVRFVSTMKYEVFDLNLTGQWGILIRRDHPLAEKESVTVGELQNEKLIIPDNTRFSSDIREWFGSGYRAAATYSLLSNAMILTEVSGWVTICLRKECSVGDNLVFVPLHPKREASALLIWKKQPVYSAALTEFMRYIGIQNPNNR